jgi:NCS1 family nucleobase:cation symporter-1
MSFLTLGIKIPFRLRRAIVALGFGVLGFIIALIALPDAGATYEGFLLVIAYWIAPWLGVVLVDRYLRRGTKIGDLVVDEVHKYKNWAGPVAFVIATVLSIYLFANQVVYVGLVTKAVPEIGDLTPVVGFVLAGILYLVLYKVAKPTLGAKLS